MAGSEGRRLPLYVLGDPRFAVYAVSRVTSGMAATMLTAVVFWQVHEIRESAFLVAVVGLVRFVPNLLLILPAGALADRYNPRAISLFAQVVMLAAAGVLAAASAGGDAPLGLIYAMVALTAVGAAFDSPARGALLRRVTPRDRFADAIVVGGTVQQLAFVTGPVGGGFLLSLGGPDLAYGGIAGLLTISLVALAVVRMHPADHGPGREVSVAAILEGLRFVFSRQAILGAMTLDMFAVIFGGATALFPIYAKEILEVDAFGYGLLFAATDVGALLMSGVLLMVPPIERTGRTLIFAVAGFGLATIVFGLSRSFYLSLAALFFVGLFDEISVVMRQTTIQLSTPDRLRGRVTSVNMLFIGTSNQLGQVESGLVAGLVSATFAVVSGGVGCLVVVALVAAKMPGLRSYRLHGSAGTGDEEATPAAAG